MTKISAVARAFLLAVDMLLLLSELRNARVNPSRESVVYESIYILSGLGRFSPPCLREAVLAKIP